MVDAAMPAEAFAAAVRALGRPTFLERSVKLRAGSACGDRILLGVARPFGDVGLRAACLNLWSALGLGAVERGVLDMHFAAASMVHFGREGGRRPVLKAYLEFPAPRSLAPCRAFLAYKWTGNGGPARAALYRRLPAFDAAALAASLGEAGLDGPVRTLFEALFAEGMQRVDDLPLLAVEEQGVPRRSLDLNLYDAGLTLGEAAPLLGPALAAFGATPAALDAAADERLGHVSAGLGADGAPFLTIYFGARLLEAEAVRAS